MPPSVALVTGATEGIGRATAFALAEAGFRVGICARTGEKVRAMVAALGAWGPAEGLAADVGDPGDVERLVAHVTGTLGPVDLLVNNAGIGRIKPFDELTLDDWDATMRTNLRSLYLVTTAVLPGMRARKEGTIVNVASLAGRMGFRGGTAYAASKHAVLGFGRSLMLEVRADGIRVITICPGSVDTPFFSHQDMLHPDRDAILKPEDVASAILDAVRLPGRALVSELDLRPSNP